MFVCVAEDLPLWLYQMFVCVCVCDFAFLTVLGADFINLSGASMDMTKEHLQMDPTHFELEVPQLAWYDIHRRSTRTVAEERFDSLERFLRVSDTPEDKMPTPTRLVLTEEEGDDVAKSCRIHGSIPIGRVAANFHITAGLVPCDLLQHVIFGAVCAFFPHPSLFER